MESITDTLYVSDMDGTLLDGESRVSAESRRLLNAAIAAGALFTVATARTPATVAGLLQGIDLPLDAIVMTGAAHWNLQTGRYSHVKHFPAPLAQTIIQTLLQYRYPSFIYTLDQDLLHIYRVGPMNAMEKDFIAWRVHTPFKRVNFDTSESGDVWNQPLPDPSKVILFYSLQPEEAMEQFVPVIKGVAPDASVLHYLDGDPGASGLGSLEMFAPGATKANAVRQMAEELGVKRTVVFGDNVNDLTMLRCADMAVAPLNAIEAVKQTAAQVIGPNTDNSVARFIARQCRINC